MADPGWVGAYGAAGGYEYLANLIAERKKDEILRQKAMEAERDFALREWQAQQQAEQNRLTNERLFRGEERAEEREARAALQQKAQNLTENTPIGARLGLPQIATLAATDQQGLVGATPITQTPGLIEKLGGPAAAPTGPVTGGESIYTGTAKQQHEQFKEELDQARYERSIAQDEESKRRAEAHEAAVQARFDESQARLSGQFAASMAQRGQLSPAQELVQTRQLANDYVRQAATYQTMNRQLQNMQSALQAAKQGKRLASDESIIVSWERMLDPNSVVREGEYARVGGGAPILNRMTEIVRRAREGGSILNIQHLQELTDLAAQFTENARAYNDANRNRIGRIADAYGLDRTQIFPDEPAAPGTVPGASPPAVTPAPAAPAPMVREYWNPKTRKLERR